MPTKTNVNAISATSLGPQVVHTNIAMQSQEFTKMYLYLGMCVNISTAMAMHTNQIKW